MPYERFFDHVAQVFRAGETKLLPVDVALFLARTSLVRWEPVGNVGTYAIALDGEEGYGVSLPASTMDTPELLDRSVSDSYQGVQRFADHPVKPKVIGVPGGALLDGKPLMDHR